jgi:glucose-fructose oxidoreductase
MQRRKFVWQTATGLVGVAFSAQSLPNILIPAAKNKLGVALVGLGYYSTDLLAPALQLTEHCYLAGVVTGSPAKAEKWKKQFSIADKNLYNYADFDSIANNRDIDVVYVVLPPSMHAAFSIRAAKAGKHVWCEKPMAMTAQECQQMINACNDHNVKLSIGYRMHHEPNTQRIIQFAKDQPYGKVTKAQAAAGYFEGRTNHWKQIKRMGGGAMYDMGVYPLNAARYSTGLEPIAVTARTSTTRPEIYKEVEETVAFDLEFPGDVTASCESSFGKNMNELKVTCSRGWYELSPFQSYSGVQGITSNGTKLNATIPNEQARQMDDDALAILNNTPVLVPGEEGLKDIRVVEAIYRSASEKKKIAIS